MPELDGRIALITGASRGIGRACALELAAAGAAVGVNYRSDADGAAAVVSEIEAAGGRALALAPTSPSPRRRMPSSRAARRSWARSTRSCATPASRATT